MLPANALWKQSDQRKIQRMAACKVILAQIFIKIKNHSRVNPDAPYTVCPVPSFCFGYPLYDINEAIPYIKETLEEQGYQVWIVDGNNLFISWMKPEKQENRPFGLKAKPTANYRPFVYDESSMQFLREKTE